MKGRFGRLVVKYIQENTSILILLLIAFIVGIIAGSFMVNTLDSSQKGELYSSINGLLESKDAVVSQGELFRQIFFNYLKFILTLWFIGVTIVGIPLIIGLIGFKGFTIGFTIGFMLDVFTDLRGWLIIISSIVPQTLIILPCIIVLSVSGIKLSLFLLRGGNSKKLNRNEIKIRLVSHTFMAMVILIITALGSLLESFILPMFLNIISSNFYN